MEQSLNPKPVWIAALLLVPPAAAADPPASAPGWMLTFEPVDRDPTAAGDRPPDIRTARVAALYVPAGTPASPFLPPGRFRAVWEGDLNVPRRGRYAFSADGRGTLAVTVDGARALDAAGDDLSARPGVALQLDRGRRRVTARFESPASGDAGVRLFWSSDDFPRAPVPPDRVTHDPAAPGLREGLMVREGRETFATLRCNKCHLDSVPAGVGGMPELAMDAPSLADIGKKHDTLWFARWIQDPRAYRSDTTMPVTHLEGAPAEAPKGIDAHALDIAVYLHSLGGRDREPLEKATPPESAAAGARLYADLGCVACHTLPDDKDAGTADGRVPLGHVTEKWRSRALREFLQQPQKTHAWTRMPDFHLNEEEALQLAAFLFTRSKPMNAATVQAGNADVGRNLVASSGCLNCHALPGLTNSFHAPALKDIPQDASGKGCLGDPSRRSGPEVASAEASAPKAPSHAASRGRAPDYGLTPAQRGALAAFLATDRASLGRESLPEFAERQIRLLRCAACHRRDGQEDAWTGLAEETDALLASLPPAPPEPPLPPGTRVVVADPTRPSLTWAGEKLRPEWTASFLAGNVPWKPRPWLRARMPSFPAPAALLARGLALEHGCPPASPPEPAADMEAAQTGRRLAGKAGGFGCTQCHRIGAAQPAGAVYEVEGVNFMRVKDRLRKEYFLRWLRNPFLVEPGTRMPQFATDEGRTSIRDVFEGDAERQFDAIWEYLKAGEAIAPPEN